MNKIFDELFDDFFKRNKIEPNNKIGSFIINDEVKKMIDMLMNFKDISNINEETEKGLDETLGAPDRIEFFTDDDLYFEKRIWDTPNGMLYKIIATDEPSMDFQRALDDLDFNTRSTNFVKKPNRRKKNKKPLQQQLDEAISNENYEKAAKLRDLIKFENNQ